MLELENLIWDNSKKWPPHNKSQKRFGRLKIAETETLRIPMIQYTKSLYRICDEKVVISVIYYAKILAAQQERKINGSKEEMER